MVGIPGAQCPHIHPCPCIPRPDVWCLGVKQGRGYDRYLRTRHDQRYASEQDRLWLHILEEHAFFISTFYDYDWSPALFRLIMFQVLYPLY